MPSLPGTDVGGRNMLSYSFAVGAALHCTRQPRDFNVSSPHIYIDADGCPVKDEVYRVARRFQLPVTLVANKWMHTPDDPSIHLQIVGDGFDEADDWIVDHCGPDDIVIAIDIPLADRCLKRGARVLGHKGRPFTIESIGDVLASREIANTLRDAGVMTGGPAPFGKQDRSRFLQALDKVVNAALRSVKEREGQ